MLHLIENNIFSKVRISDSYYDARVIAVCLYPNMQPSFMFMTKEGWCFADLPVEAQKFPFKSAKTPPPLGSGDWTWTPANAIVHIRVNSDTESNIHKGTLHGFISGTEDNVLYGLVITDFGVVGWYTLSRINFHSKNEAWNPPNWEKARGAACIFLFTKDKKVLAVRRKDSDFFGCPGGKIESGETPYAAAIRELHEETGINLLIDLNPKISTVTQFDHQYVEDTLVTTFFLQCDTEISIIEKSHNASWISFEQFFLYNAYPNWLPSIITFLRQRWF